MLRCELHLGLRPSIVQRGLCLHGTRSTESFCLRGMWSLHAYHYRGEILFRSERHPFRAGYVSLVPPDLEVKWRFPTHAPHYYAHFRMGPNQGRPVLLPCVQDLGLHFDRFNQLFEELVQFRPDETERADVRLWDLLFQLSANRSPHTTAVPLHPNLQIALSIIRNQPSDTVRIGQIARTMGVSHGHLTQLFKKQFGCGPREHLRREKIARARHLLRHSSLSVKSIANEVGIPDLHYFNKLIRKASGQSPRNLRSESRLER